MLSPDAGDGGDGDHDHGPERVLADPVAELATELWMVSIPPARAAGKVETTWAFPAVAAPLLRLVLGPVPIDEIAWILFRRTWVEPRT